MYLGVRKGILAVLTGQSFEDVANQLRLPGMHVSAARPNVGGLLQESNQPVGNMEVVGATKSIPVYPGSLVGSQNSEAWPAVQVYLRKIIPRTEDKYVRYNKIRSDVSGTAKEITFPDDTVVTRADLFKQRKHPRPYDLRFDIRIDSRREYEMAIIAERVLELLDTEFLTVPLRDGTCVDYDVGLDEPVLMAIPGGTLEGEPYGEYIYELPYTVEAYLDNSLAGQLMRRVSRRTTGFAGLDYRGELQCEEITDAVGVEPCDVTGTDRLFTEDDQLLTTESGEVLEADT